jgi:hypothetical protein
VSHSIRTSTSLPRGEALVGVVFFIAGLIVAWHGAAKLAGLYRQFSGYFPISLPPNVADTVLVSFPIIFQIFVNTVGSICAVILGLVWMIYGAADAVATGKRKVDPTGLDRPELIAESLRTGQPLHWRAHSLPIRIAARLGARLRFMSPVSYALLGHAVRSTIKLILIIIITGLTFHLLRLSPALLQKYAGIHFQLTVPWPSPLYYLLAMLIVANALISASLIPIKRPGYTRSCEPVVLRGTGDPHFFFALLEEGCRLLSETAAFLRIPKRLELESNDHVQGTLVESSPEPVASASRPAGYLCLPFVIVLLTLGFDRLIDFHRPVTSMYYTTFLSVHLLDYLLEIAFGLGMILSGAYFGDWARQLLGVRRFRSALVFCHLTNDDPAMLAGSPATEGPEAAAWKTAHSVDPRFVTWARELSGPHTFRVQLYWAEVTTESISDKSPRCVADMQGSAALEAVMQRLIMLPVHVNFDVVSEDSRSPESNSPRESDVNGERLS